VANLLLARASVRHREIALRQAMGASRWRLVRQMLTESVVLSVIGGTLGSTLAFFGLAKFMQAVTSHLPRPFPTLAVNVTPDFHVFGYALKLTMVTGVAFGVVPAWQNSRSDLNAALKEGGAHSGSSDKSRQLLRNTLIGAQSRSARSCCWQQGYYCGVSIMRKHLTRDLRRRAPRRYF
jgi:predicted lysophospholipase L1 biosynthesis ABC-type transport system permease subunit